MHTTQRQARDRITGLITKYQAMSKDARSGITEAGVVHQFLDPLFAALGWPVDDPRYYKYELHTYGGPPDMTLIPEKGGTLYVEAKRFGVIRDLQQARRTMADRQGGKRHLPLILNQNIQVGNTLVGAGPGDVRLRRARRRLESATVHPRPARFFISYLYSDRIISINRGNTPVSHK